MRGNICEGMRESKEGKKDFSFFFNFFFFFENVGILVEVDVQLARRKMFLAKIKRSSYSENSYNNYCK